MGVSFVHINEESLEDFKSLSLISNILKDNGLRTNDNFWENLILNYINLLYNDFTPQEKQFLRTNNEKKIGSFSFLSTNGLFPISPLNSVRIKFPIL